MSIIEIALGAVIVLGAITVTLGVLASKEEGKGLSAAIGGLGATMSEKSKSHIDKTINKIIVCGAVVCGAGVLALNIAAAHL